jgi:hypothetical protein
LFFQLVSSEDSINWENVTEEQERRKNKAIQKRFIDKNLDKDSSV